VLFALRVGQLTPLSQTIVASRAEKFVIHNFVVQSVPNAPGADPGSIGTSTERWPNGFAVAAVETKRIAIVTLRQFMAQIVT
jgi:hypothetical protein